jgi:hypothetical protein
MEGPHKRMIGDDDDAAFVRMPWFDGAYSRTGHYLGRASEAARQAWHEMRARHYRVDPRWPAEWYSDQYTGQFLGQWLQQVLDPGAIDGTLLHNAPFLGHLLDLLPHDRALQERLAEVANATTGGCIPIYFTNTASHHANFDGASARFLSERVCNAETQVMLRSHAKCWLFHPKPPCKRLDRISITILIECGPGADFLTAYSHGMIDDADVRGVLAERPRMRHDVRWILFNLGFGVPTPSADHWLSSFGWSRRAHHILHAETLRMLIFDTLVSLPIGEVVRTLLLCFRRLCPRMPPDIREMLLVRVMS